MDNKFKIHNLFNLIKLNLKVCRIPRIMCFGMMLFLFISYKIIKPLSEFSFGNNLNVNIWDGFFKVITYPIIVLCVYFPIVVIVTSITDVKIGHNQHLIIRSRKKILWIESKLISNLFIGLILSILFFLAAFLMSYIFLDFSNTWSSAITNTEISTKFIDVLYLGNFVFSLTPVQAGIVSFLEIYIATAIIISFRDVLSNYIRNIYICNLIVSMYIFISIIGYMYLLTIKIFEVMRYISLNTIAIISFHRFGNIRFFDITLVQSFITSLILLSILVGSNLIFSRRLEVKCD